MKARKYLFLDSVKRFRCGIYKISNPTGDVYIGQSRCMLRRWRLYTQLKQNPQESKIVASILKYGVNNHSFSVVHELPNDVSDVVLDDYEQIYIDSYRECGVVLLNIREAGFNGKHSKESILKMKGRNGKWMIGRKMSKERVEKQVASRKRNNKPVSEETRIRNREAQLGEKNSMVKLKEADVLEIIRLRKVDGKSYGKLAELFNVSRSGIYNIFNGHTWAYLTNIKTKAK